jgi:UDP-glucose 4-epimerase
MNPSETLLITGGTGSFGRQFLTSLLALPDERAPGKVLIFSRDEEKQFYQRHDFPDPRVEYLIGDIRDRERCVQALADVDIVVHAAALKQVPTGEYFPTEMIRTNVMGTENLVLAARANGVRKFVFLSTDKAVYPINAYGMSKAVAEKIILAAAGHNMTNGNGSRNGTTFATVRYGNVMGSRGSVIPLFMKQISEGNGITVTHGEMTRFLLKLTQATSLVFYAIEHGVQGRLHVCRSPACTLDSLIKAMEIHFERELKRDIIGVRPGEKMHETLLTADELARATEVNGQNEGGDIIAIRSYFECKMAPDPVVYDKFLEDLPQPKSDFTSKDTRLLNPQETLGLLQEASLL